MSVSRSGRKLRAGHMDPFPIYPRPLLYGRRSYQNLAPSPYDLKASCTVASAVLPRTGTTPKETVSMTKMIIEMTEMKSGW